MGTVRVTRAGPQRISLLALYPSQGDNRCSERALRTDSTSHRQLGSATCGAANVRAPIFPTPITMGAQEGSSQPRTHRILLPLRSLSPSPLPPPPHRSPTIGNDNYRVNTGTARGLGRGSPKLNDGAASEPRRSPQLQRPPPAPPPAPGAVTSGGSMRCSVRTKSGGGTERRRTGDQFLIPIDGEGREEGGNGEQRGGRAGGGPPLRRTPAGVEALGDRRATNLEPADIKPRPIPEHRSHVRRHLWGGGEIGEGGGTLPPAPGPAPAPPPARTRPAPRRSRRGGQRAARSRGHSCCRRPAALRSFVSAALGGPPRGEVSRLFAGFGGKKINK